MSVTKQNTINLRRPLPPITPGVLKLDEENPAGHRIRANSFYLEWDGRPYLPVMGEFHYSRFDERYWEEEILKMKAGGVQIVATYCIWNHHEEIRGEFDFSGRRNLRKFVELCQKHGMKVWLRIGPFCHGEVRNGGMPDWLYGQPFELRSNDPRYLALADRLYGEYGRQLKGLFFKDNGPIIGVQLENEFMHSQAPWETTQLPNMDYVPRGSDGEAHILTLKKLAVSNGIDAPIYSATAWGGAPIPAGEVLPVLGGGYAFHAWLDDPSEQKPTRNYLFTDLRKESGKSYDMTQVPYAGCETGGGMQPYYRNRPVVPPEYIDGVSVTQLGSGANVMGFYMYHGGSNPVGEHSYLNENRCPRIAYDYQAPIREFGQVNESYRLLKRQFLFLHEFGSLLAPDQVVLPDNAGEITPENVTGLRFSARVSAEDSGFLFLCNTQDHVKTRDQEGVQLTLRLKKTELTLPSQGGFTLPSGKNLILPFHLNLGGVNLIHATAQPITRIADADGCSTFFFFAADGIDAEFAFAPDQEIESPCSGISISGGEAGIRYVRVTRAGTGCCFELPVRETGTRVRVAVLTEEQSRYFWKAEFDGREYAFLSDADLFFTEERIEMRKCGSSAMSLSVFPGTAHFRSLPESAWRSDGMFNRISFPAEDREVKADIRRIGADRILITFPDNVMDGVNDLFLRIRYDADMGEAFLDGRLIDDNFGNGTPWEIGLKQFMPEVVAKGLLLKFLPRKSESEKKVKCTEMAALQSDSAGNGIVISAIDLIPEYSRSVALRSRSIQKTIR